MRIVTVICAILIMLAAAWVIVGGMAYASNTCVSDVGTESTR